MLGVEGERGVSDHTENDRPHRPGEFAPGTDQRRRAVQQFLAGGGAQLVFIRQATTATAGMGALGKIAEPFPRRTSTRTP